MIVKNKKSKRNSSVIFWKFIFLILNIIIKDKVKYKDKLISTQKKTGEKDALIVFKGNVRKTPVIVCAFEYAFFGGSMG